MRLLICEIKSGPVTNDVARVVIDSTRNLFLLVLNRTTLHTVRSVNLFKFLFSKRINVVFISDS